MMTTKLKCKNLITPWGLIKFKLISPATVSVCG